MKRILGLLCVVLCIHSLYTSTDWLKKGFNVKDGIYEEPPNYKLTVDTSCRDVQMPATYGNSTVLSGYLKVGKGGSALAVVFYGKENVPRAQLKDVPTVVWLNGGPGSSSQLGNFFQLGPYKIQQNIFAPFELLRNNQSWTLDYNILFVDQPIGTGLSYADSTYPNVYCKSMSDVADDFYFALKELYDNQNGCFNKLGIKQSQPIVMFGESYAGKYVPAIANKIISERKKNNFLTGFKGIAVGDGFTHPYTTLSMMGEYAYNLGLLDFQERVKVEQIILNATYQHQGMRWADLHSSFELVLSQIQSAAGGVNVYDITKFIDYPTRLLDQYFSRPEVITQFGLRQDIIFNSQSANVYQGLYDDFMKDYVQLVQNLLSENLQVLIYTGQNDLIVDTPGTLRWVERIQYSKSEEFRNTLFNTWKINDTVAGYVKAIGNLELRTVNNAGHLVPMDQPIVSRALLNLFIKKVLS